MKVLLTGAGGMLGFAIRNIFDSRADVELFSFAHSQLDVANEQQVMSVVSEIKPDVIINAAAYTNVDLAEQESNLAFNVNAEALRHLSLAANSCKALLLTISTDYVFDGQRAEGYEEEDDTNPINVYGSSKLKGEEYVRSLCERFAIVRSSWLFGPNGKNFVDTIIGLAKERPQLKIVDDQVGCPTYTVHLAAALVSLIDEIVAGRQKENEIYHLSNSSALSWFEFAKKFLTMAKIPTELLPVSSEEFPRPAKRPAYSILKNTKLPTLPSIDEALIDYLK